MLDGWLKWWPKLIFFCVAKIIFVSKMRRYFGHFRVQNYFGHFRVQNQSHFGHACPKLTKICQNAWPKLIKVAKMRNSGQNATWSKLKMHKNTWKINKNKTNFGQFWPANLFWPSCWRSRNAIQLFSYFDRPILAGHFGHVL